LRFVSDPPSTSTAAVRDVDCLMLGTGTSSGVPVIGCDCDVCTSDDPHDHRLRCSACIRFTDSTNQRRLILIDTSPDLREQALRHNLRRCDAILYTHNHVDHVFGLDEVRRFNILMRDSIDVWADEHTMQSLFRVYQHIFERRNNVNDSFVATLVPRLIEPEHTVDVHGVRFTPVKLLHGRLPVLGFRADALDASGRIAADQPAPLPLAYCTDVSSIPPETWPRLTGLRTLILDMLRFRHHPTHMTVDQAIDAAERIAAERTYFTHMTHDIRHAELDPQLPDGMALAYDGLVIAAGEKL
jgi:phosphoribosyl 1,2-cyclic phosphate phosphodiesterase